MFKSVFETTTEGLLTNESLYTVLMWGVILGFLISLTYIFSDRDKKYSPHFAFTLVILPVIVSMVILLIGSDIAKAISLGGVFTLVRFRSVPGDSKDITNVFFTMAVGLALGMGYQQLAVMFTVVICIIYFVLVRFGYGVRRVVAKELKINIPENLEYEGVFEDLFKEYTNKVTLQRVKTTNLGTLYELTYIVEMKKNVNEKQFIDSLRCRNGNLTISLGQVPARMDVL
ncbi:MAG: DUF4956 domain-containing protein [Lachnospiraceae bacterium]|nr:DUF4956 domain-containing protein [Lachnospiraceae bacterium]